MRTTLRLVIAGLWVLAWPGSARAQEGSEYDFAITPAFLERLAGGGLLPAFRIRVDGRSNVHSLSKDCEVHLGGEFVDADFGDPMFAVVEPPNLCRFRPGATTPSTGTSGVWHTLLDSKVIGRECTIAGFPRLFTEHASGGSDTGGSNPNHVFELHPATMLTCNPDLEPLDFVKFISAPVGLRHITPGTAANCIANRQLRVRFNRDTELYEFRENRNVQCGNFAIVEIGALNPQWIRRLTGGHSAIARVSADGMSRASLKLYTLAGTTIDAFLEKEIGRAGTRARMPRERLIVHGVLTYDYFSIITTLRSAPGAPLERPDDWTEVAFPLAFVVYGTTTTIPWAEEI